MPELDICIPYRGRPDLLPCIALALQAWAMESDAYKTTVRIADCDGDEWRNGQARNNAARQGKSPYILFADADMVIEPGGLTAILADCRPGHQFAYTRWLNPGGSEDRWEHDIPLPDVFTHDWWHAVALNAKGWRSAGTMYGPNLISREDFERVGGYDERYTGWGAEDDAFIISCKRAGLEQVSIATPRFLHLPHLRVRDPACYQANFKLLQELWDECNPECNP